MPIAPKDPHYEARVRDSFDKQMFMATLGATLARVGPGEVTISLPVRKALLQQHGSVHAGAIASVLDSAAGYAALSLMPPGAAVVSVEFKLNLLEPAVGQRIEARARVVRSGRTLSACTAEAWAIDAEGGERLVAILQGTIRASWAAGAWGSGARWWSSASRSRRCRARGPGSHARDQIVRARQLPQARVADRRWTGMDNQPTPASRVSVSSRPANSLLKAAEVADLLAS